MHCVIGRSCVQYQVGTIPNLQVELPTGQILQFKIVLSKIQLVLIDQSMIFWIPVLTCDTPSHFSQSCYRYTCTCMRMTKWYVFQDYFYNKDNIIQDEKRQYKAQCWSNVTQQMCHVKEFWDKQSRYFTYTNQTSVYFNRLMCINSLQIFKTKKDIPKRKMPSFCNLKDLSKKQQLFFIS